MIHVEAFVQSLEALNVFLCHRAIRAYQQQILDRGQFRVVCPRTGQSLAPDVCYVANNGDAAHGNIGIAYRFACDPAIWLLANSVKDGFPITEAFQPAQGASLWSLGEAYFEENRAWKRQLRALEAGLAGSTPPALSLQEPHLLLGHPNFAHNLWNELAAVHAYAMGRPGAGADSKRVLRVKAIYEPLLPVEQLVAPASVSVTRLDRFEQLVGLQETMVTRLGSTQIPSELRSKVTGLLYEGRNRRLTNGVISALRDCQPVVWLSARLDARTPDNQQELLLRVIHAIAAAFPRAGFILDGFSYPDDFEREIYRQQAGTGPWRLLRKWTCSDGFLSGAMRSRERAISACTRRLQRILGRSIPNPVVNTTGMCLANAIAVGASADYYVCHGGTLQHKIAWLYNIPGIVHCNVPGLQAGVREWLADQLEDGHRPSLISTQWVKDLESIRTANQVERNRDYHILDVERVCAEILSDLQATVAASLPG